MKINQLLLIIFYIITFCFNINFSFAAEPPIQVFHYNERLDKLKKDAYIACNDKRVTLVVRTFKQPQDAEVKLHFNKMKEIMLFSSSNAQKADSSAGFRHTIVLAKAQRKIINKDVSEYQITLLIDPNQFDALKVANLAQKGKVVQCNILAQLVVKGKAKKEDKLTFNVTSSNDPNHIYVSHKHLAFSTFEANLTKKEGDMLEYHIEFANEPYQRLAVPDSVYIVFHLKSNFDTFVVKQHYLNVRFRDNTSYFSAEKKGDSLIFKFRHLHNNVFFVDEKDDIFRGGLRFSIYPKKEHQLSPVLRYRGDVYFFLDSQFVDKTHRHYNSDMKAIAEPFSKLHKVYLHGGYTCRVAVGLSAKAKPSNADKTHFDIYGIDAMPRLRLMAINSKHSRWLPYISPELTLGTRHGTDTLRKETAAMESILVEKNRFLLADIGLFLRYNYLNSIELGVGLNAEFAFSKKNITNKSYPIPIQKYVCLDFNRKIFNANIGARYYLPWEVLDNDSAKTNNDVMNKVNNVMQGIHKISTINRQNYYQIYIGLSF